MQRHVRVSLPSVHQMGLTLEGAKLICRQPGWQAASRGQSLTMGQFHRDKCSTSSAHRLRGLDKSFQRAALNASSLPRSRCDNNYSKLVGLA